MFGTQTQVAGPQAQAGPDLPTVTTESIGFNAAAGDVKIRLLATAWPDASLPQPTSSLLSVASKKGILAAAGPDAVVVASTQAVREAFLRTADAKEDNVRPFNPQLSLPMQQRISQLSFSSDEAFLVMTAADGGGLAVYGVDTLLQGNTQMSFAIPTNNIGVRALVPNPTDGSMFALVLTDGKLMVVNLQGREFVKGPNGPVLREGVSCVSWSAKGKQMVAGLANGSCLQMTPDGAVKAELPYPPQVRANQSVEHHVSTLSWLNNDTFLAMYTPSNAPGGGIPDSQYLIIQRQPKTANFTFQRIPDPCPPFGLERTPSHHFICRLKEFPPALSDTLIVSCSTAGDIGIFANSAIPLASDEASRSTANTYVYAAMADDSRRAQLPVDGMSDTSPIGMALDLSSNEPVKRPIPADSEIDASATPLPLLLSLNNQGVLSAWWFVYSNSVREKTAYPGLIAAAGAQQQQQQQQQPSRPVASFGTPSAAPSAPFGTPNASSTSAFGAPTAITGSRPSPWAGQTGTPQSATPAFGKPAFGAPSFGAPGGASFGAPGGNGFGTPGGLGLRTSAWGTPTNAAAPTDKPSPFAAAASGSSPFGALASNKSAASPFGAVSNNTASSSPFGGAAADTSAKSPVGGLGGQNKPSVFSSATPAPPLSTGPSFGSTVTIGSSLGGETSFGAPSTFGSGKSPWATPSLSTNPSDQAKAGGDDAMMDDDTQAENTPKVEAKSVDVPKTATNLFGLPSGGFQLSGQKNAEPPSGEPQKPSGKSLFGASFGAELDKAVDTTPSQPVKQEPKDNSTASLPDPASQDKAEAAVTASDKTKDVEAAVPEDDPLPPDPITNKKLYESVKDPLPVFGSQAASKDKVDVNEVAEPKKPDTTTTEETPAPKEPSAPSPPSPKPALPDDDDSASLAGSSPVDLGAPEAEGSSSPIKGSAGSMTQEKPVTAETSRSRPSSPSRLPVTSRPGPSFSIPKAGLALEPPTARDGSSLDAQQKASSSLFNAAAGAFTPGKTTATVTSDTPATAAFKPPVLFPVPGGAQESPRSPSPVRADRSIPSSGSPATRRISPMRSKSTQRLKSPSRIAATSIDFNPPKAAELDQIPRLQIQPTQSSRDPVPKTPASPGSPGSSASGDSLINRAPVVEDDTTDLAVDKELNESVVASKAVPVFTAHQDYVSNLRFPAGLPTSTEKVYRDIQSMIDNLGLNARALASFIKWHEEAYSDGGRTRSDLAKEGDWCLVEVEDLGVTQRELEKHLEAERLESPREKVSQLTSMLRELGRLRTRHADIHRLVALHSTDTAEAERARKAHLSTEQASVLRDLRKSYAKTQSQLSRAEDALTELSAKLASLDATKDGGKAQPTVEAVINTITKMTRMAEDRRNAVDVLEAQLRRAGFRPRGKGVPSQNGGSEADDLGMSTLSLSASQRVNRFSTPRSKAQASPGRFKLEFSSDEEDYEDAGSTYATPLRRSTTSQSSASRSSANALVLHRARGELPQPSKEAVAEYKSKQARKTTVCDKLRARIIAHTPAL